MTAHLAQITAKVAQGTIKQLRYHAMRVQVATWLTPLVELAGNLVLLTNFGLNKNKHARAASQINSTILPWWPVQIVQMVAVHAKSTAMLNLLFVVAVILDFPLTSHQAYANSLAEAIKCMIKTKASVSVFLVSTLVQKDANHALLDAPLVRVSTANFNVLAAQER